MSHHNHVPFFVTQMRKISLKLKLSKIQYKKSQMFHPDQMFYCQCELFIPKLNKTFADPVMNMTMNKFKAPHHLLFKANETAMASYCVYSPQVTTRL